MKETGNILDEIPKEDKYENQLVRLFPFFLLLIGLLSLLVFTPFSQANFFIGLSLLSINGLILFVDRKKGIFFTGIVILLASINLVDFLPFEIRSKNVGKLAIDFVSIILFLGAYALVNEKIFFEYWRKIVPLRKDAEEKDLGTKIDYYKRRFKDKNSYDLKAIVNNPSMTSDARNAALELLDEKKNGN